MDMIPPAADHLYLVQYAIVLFVFACLATFTVILRFWARRVQKVKLALNDYLMIPSLLFTLGGAIFTIYACFLGMKKVQSVEDIKQAIAFAGKDGFTSTLLWILSVTFIRASVIFLYMHIFPKRPFRFLCYSVLVINFAFCLGSVLADCLICRPISYPFNPSVKGGICRPGKNMAMSIGILNLALDVAVVVMPMPILWALKLTIGKKIAVSSIFGMGLAVCAITLYRIYVTTTINDTNAGNVYPLVSLLASLEALFGTINACLPMLRPIFSKVLGSRHKNSNATSATSALGSVTILQRAGHLWSRSPRSYTSYNEEPPSSEANDAAICVSDKSAIPPELKANGEMGIKMAEIHVRKEFDVESVLYDDHLPHHRQSEGEDGHWAT